jgi:ACS family tartrate transporter-like MFS transporter
MDQGPKRSVLNKVARRLLPFLFVLYVINILDRSNIGMAGLKKDALGLSPESFGWVSGIFYLGYILFEVPSNLILRRVGARRWMARIMIGWGLVTCLTMAAYGPWSFCLMRILLGVAEAGFFPGIVLYLTAWFPGRQRARAVAFFMAASPITSVVFNPISGGILEYMDGVGGLMGWQWLFVLEGAPAVILGLITLVYLTDAPHQAEWLTEEERNWLAEEIAREQAQSTQRHSATLTDVVYDRRVWLLIALYFTAAVGANAFGTWAPQLLRNRFTEEDDLQIGLLAAVPGIFAVVFMIGNGLHSDRTGERRWHVAVPALIAALGLSCYVFVDVPLAALAGLVLAQSGINGMLPTFWALPPTFLRGVAAAGGIALINSVGNIGGFVGPVVIGHFKRKDDADPDRFASGLLIIAGILCIGAVLALCVRKPQTTGEM